MFGDLNNFQGIVLAIKANYYIVQIEGLGILPLEASLKNHNELKILCTLRRSLAHRGSFVNVGDYVCIESIDWNLHRGVIFKLNPRRNLLFRPPVANVTHVFVVLSIHSPGFDLEQASRFLLTAEQSYLNVSVIINKSDLALSKELDAHLNRMQSWGYKSLAVSVKNGQGLDILMEQIRRTRLAVLCGPSGVGKSSLLNYLLPNESIHIGDLSGKLKRGKHTTRHVQLYPVGVDRFVADTPGFNRPDIKIKPKDLHYLFPEIRSQLQTATCKFRDCLHRDEPGCTVDKNWERYTQYRQLLNQMINSLC